MEVLVTAVAEGAEFMAERVRDQPTPADGLRAHIEANVEYGECGSPAWPGEPRLSSTVMAYALPVDVAPMLSVLLLVGLLVVANR